MKAVPEHSPFGIDGRRRMLLGGVAGAVAAALLTSCKRKDGTEVAAPAVSPEPETAGVVAALPDVSIPVGMEAMPEEELAYARKLLSGNTCIDVHCHPGMFFFEGTVAEDPVMEEMASNAGFQQRTVADMAAGGCNAALFATVADIRLIGAGEQGLFARRDFKQGEAYQDHLRQLATLNKMVESGMVMQARTPADVMAAQQAGKTAAIFSCEGADFLEQNIDRVEEAWQAGIRCIGLVHYHVNHLGDIQTAAPVHSGLSEFGKRAVAEMNRLGMIVDLAHASYFTSKDAVEASSQPVMISHSFLATDAPPHPRLLTADHALMVAETGGLIGVWPTGIGNPGFMGFIDRLLHLLDTVGVDHVGLGTDLDANYKPVFTNYRQLPYMAATLKRRNMRDDEIIKVLGGNFMRIFDQVTRAANPKTP